MADSTAQNRVPAGVAEAETVRAKVCTWLNTYTGKPCKISYEYLNDVQGMALSSIQSAYKTKSYIDGSYQATAEMTLIYRLSPVSDAERIAADEKLSEVANWAASEPPPTIGTSVKILRIQRATDATLQARYEDAVEDHTTQINIIYEVTKNG